MHWVYLSPHFDDAALSCGGLIWQQVQSGDTVEIWTICAGLPPADQPFSDFAGQLHARWMTPPAEVVNIRRAEDEQAGAKLGAVLRYWHLPDCIYRRLPDGHFLVNGEEDLYQPAHPQEHGVVQALQAWMRSALPDEVCLVSPMTLGGHVDHRLVRAAAEGMDCPLRYYADYPYIEKHPEALAALVQPDWRTECFEISDTALQAWGDAIAAYTSQISTFWGGLDPMRAAIGRYRAVGGGACLWYAPRKVESTL